jgi:hypothetical protein
MENLEQIVNNNNNSSSNGGNIERYTMDKKKE